MKLQTGTGAAFDDGTGVATIDDVQPWTADAAGQASSCAREYRYDPAGRPTYVRSADTIPGPGTGTLVPTCTERAYMFDANDRRTALATALATTSHPDGDRTSTASSAVPATTSTISTTGWDSADLPTTDRDGTGSYSYDLFGRQSTLPAADAPNPAGGDITLGYYDDDLPRAVTQGDTSTTFTHNAAGRRSTQTTTLAGTTTTVRRYTDDGDNPAWIETTPPGATAPAITRFAESIGGDLPAIISADGITPVPSRPARRHHHHCAHRRRPDQHHLRRRHHRWASYDEYGNPATTGGSAIDHVDGPIGYGWLGAKQRSTTTDTAGLTLMGVRLYNPARELFTSVDAVEGGSASSYAYPYDPVNQYDLDGKNWFTDKVSAVWKVTGSASRWLTDSKWGSRIGAPCGFAWGAFGAACGGVYAAAYARQGRYAAAAGSLIGGFVGARTARLVGGAYSKVRFTTHYSRGDVRIYRRVFHCSSQIHGVAADGAFGYAHDRWRVSRWVPLLLRNVPCLRTATLQATFTTLSRAGLSLRPIAPIDCCVPLCSAQWGC